MPISEHLRKVDASRLVYRCVFPSSSSSVSAAWWSCQWWRHQRTPGGLVQWCRPRPACRRWLSSSPTLSRLLEELLLVVPLGLRFLVGPHENRAEEATVHGAAVEDDAVLLVVADVGGDGDVVDAGGQFREPEVVRRPGKIKKTHINKLEKRQRTLNQWLF